MTSPQMLFTWSYKWSMFIPLKKTPVNVNVVIFKSIIFQNLERSNYFTDCINTYSKQIRLPLYSLLKHYLFQNCFNIHIFTILRKLFVTNIKYFHAKNKNERNWRITSLLFCVCLYLIIYVWLYVTLFLVNIQHNVPLLDLLHDWKISKSCHCPWPELFHFHLLCHSFRHF